jgi:hypothetical protein
MSMFGDVVFVIKDAEARKRIVGLFKEADAHDDTIRRLSTTINKLHDDAWALIYEIGGSEIPTGRKHLCDDEGRLIDKGPAFGD